MGAGTVDRRRALVAGAAVTVVLGLVWAVAVSRGGGDRDRAGGTETAAHPSTTAPGPDRREPAAPTTAEAPASTTVTTTVNGAPVSGRDALPVASDGEPAPPSAEVSVDLEAARAVAGTFAASYSSYRYDEPEGAALDRVRPLITAELAAVLGANSGATAEAQRRNARQEVADAAVDALLTESFDASTVEFTAVVAQTVTTVEGTTVRSLAYRLTVTREPEAWLVSDVGIF